MIIRAAHRVQFFSIALSYLTALVAGLMWVVMTTAQDRGSYVALFSEPFRNSRIEIGFQYYMAMFSRLGIPPEASIVITCMLIYALMARAWNAYVRVNWLESILIFNFFIFSLFNYYLGTSIRMGLATALALYATLAISRGRKAFVVILWASVLFQYGTLPFALIVTWLMISRKMAWRTHKMFISAAIIAVPLFFNVVLQKLGLGDYYLAYFNGSYDGTSRILPFTYAFFILAICLASFRGDDTFIRRAVFYGLPFLLYGVVTDIDIFSKILIPNIFLSAMVITTDYWDAYRKNVDSDLRVVVAVAFNGLAIVYALTAYQYI